MAIPDFRPPVPGLKPAVVLVSGGMDSAVVIAIARERGFAVHALSVRYGQRHTSELAAAAELALSQGAVAHKVVSVDLRSIGGSALTADIAVPEAAAVVGACILAIYMNRRNTLSAAVKDQTLDEPSKVIQQ